MHGGLDFWGVIRQTRNDGQNWIRKPASLRARRRPGPAQKGRMGRLKNWSFEAPEAPRTLHFLI